ncbi:MAG: DUF4270 family protein [Phycisphaerales bacterium]|nr:DUF4270 family protein [Phycisphaerales bacterium]
MPKLATITFAALLLFGSCKENTVVRKDIVPAVDNIKIFGTDTLTLLTKTVREDTIATSAYSSGYAVYVGAGAITGDPVFGKTKSSFYFQVRPPQDNYNFDKTKYQLDSAVLVLPYSGFSYGDTTSSALSQTFRAYRLTENISFDSIYYANTPKKSMESTPFATTTISLATLFHSFYDSTIVGGVKRAPHLRMRINDALTNELINNTGSSNYTNTAAFLEFFKGIYIETDYNGNTIPYFALTGSDIYTKANILMYYHTINSGGAITDTLVASYPFDPASTSGAKTAFFSTVSHDYSGTPAEVLFSSTAESDNTFMIQNLPGAALDIRIPNVKNLPLCIVNKAELVITQVPSPLDNIFAYLGRVYPKVIDENGQSQTITDRLPLSSSSPLLLIDGFVRVANVDGAIVNQYVINFPRELQNAIANKRKELRLRINGTQSFIGAYRLVGGGSTYSKPAYKIKLNVVYTKL